MDGILAAGISFDDVVNSAKEEACVAGAAGILLADLWPRLSSILAAAGIHPCTGVKRIIWTRIRAIPSLTFEAGGSVVGPNDPSIESVADAEQVGVKIVASEYMRDNFLGIYVLKQACGEISKDERRVLERLALARTDGITQRDLAKELGISSNNMFYVLRSLECQQLVVRQQTIIRSKEASPYGENGFKGTSAVHTNLIHLYRYAKNVDCTSQQRIERTSQDMLETLENVGGNSLTEDYALEECSKDDTTIINFLPAMNSICEKLDEANNKVLIVSDLKQALGYKGPYGHRAWRNISNRLKNAGLVETSLIKVNGKDVSSLRLLKKFDLRDFQQKTIPFGYNNLNPKPGKRGEITEQLVELPLDNQIYDMIDAVGPKGTTVPEVSRRLGIGNKRIYNRIVDMRSRFGLQLQPECYKRTKVYRVWTARNFREVPDSEKILTYSRCLPSGCESPEIQSPDDCKEVPDSEKILIYSRCLPSGCESPEIQSPDDCFISGASYHDDVNDGQNVWQLSTESSNADGALKEITDYAQPKICALENGIENFPVHPCISDRENKLIVSTSREQPLVSTTPAEQSSSRKHLSLMSTVVSIQREQRILEKLKEEKFVLFAELYRWLEDQVKNKSTIMGRKTLVRILNKLQKDGLCKCSNILIPGMGDDSHCRKTDVVFHPSIDGLSSDLLSQILEKQRLFDKYIRGKAAKKSKTGQYLRVKRNTEEVANNVNSPSEIVGSIHANGFVTPKMVRAKLLHKFLWGYLRSLPGWPKDWECMAHQDGLKNPDITCHLFQLKTALKAMPLELFFQVVGYRKEIGVLQESIRKKLRLLDLPIQQYNSLMDAHATRRLSNVFDILMRLKLVRLLTGECIEDLTLCSHTILTHALELNPYIEEPFQMVQTPSNLSFHCRPKHEFHLLNQAALNAYWEVLENLYSTTSRAIGADAFPGSAVNEVLHPRSWTSRQVISDAQSVKLLKCVKNVHPGKNLPAKQCKKIAGELNVTLDQVRRVYGRQKPHISNHKYRSILKSTEQEDLIGSDSNESASRKRQQSKLSMKHAEVVDGNNESRGIEAPVMLDNDEMGMDVERYSPTYIDKQDDHSQICKDGTHVAAEVVLQDKSAMHQHLNLLRQKRFLWTDISDRQLIMQYARHRAMRGTKYNRVFNWASISDLPACPDVCRRRINFLKSNDSTRKALMRLVNILGQQYCQFLDRTGYLHGKEALYHVSPGKGFQDVSLQGRLLCKSSIGREHSSELGLRGHWDNFEDSNLREALNEVIHCKNAAKTEDTKSFASRRRRALQDVSIDVPSISCEVIPNKNIIPSSPKEGNPYEDQPLLGIACNITSLGQTGSHYNLNGKFCKLLNNGGTTAQSQVYESLAIANAVELFKLVFLNTSVKPEVNASILSLLQMYSEHELFSAFTYLKEKEFMVIGKGVRPFVLSQKFWHKASSSPFPINTGKRAIELASYIQKQEDTMNAGFDLIPNLQCGEVLHLLAIFSLGELRIMPCLPKEGIGEDGKLANSKRKLDVIKKIRTERVKKQKISKEGNIDSFTCLNTRRAKGYPGIKIILKRTTSGSRLSAIDNNQSCYLPCFEKMQGNPHHLEATNISSLISNVLYGDMACDIQSAVSQKNHVWEKMTNYAEVAASKIVTNGMANFSPEMFKSVHSAILQAGEQGLNIGEVSDSVMLPGLQLAEVIVDTLENFQLVIKVNAYDGFRILDSSYKSKYFLSIRKHQNHVLGSPSSNKSQTINLVASPQVLPERNEASAQRTSMSDCSRDVDTVSLQEVHVREGKLSDAGCQYEYHPLLPWINGDGNINSIVYKGLTRRILGIIMQNPGILEEDIICGMDVLNPQSCRKLLDGLILDNHVTVRMVNQATCSGPPAILQCLLVSKSAIPKSVARKHFFANPTSACFL